MGHRALAFEDDALVDEELRRVDVAVDTCRCVHFHELRRLHVAVQFAAANDQGAHFDLCANLGSLAENKHVVAKYFTDELAVDAHLADEVELPFEFGTASKESVDFSGAGEVVLRHFESAVFHGGAERCKSRYKTCVPTSLWLLISTVVVFAALVVTHLAASWVTIRSEVASVWKWLVVVPPVTPVAAWRAEKRVAAVLWTLLAIAYLALRLA